MDLLSKPDEYAEDNASDDATSAIGSTALVEFELLSKIYNGHVIHFLRQEQLLEFSHPMKITRVVDKFNPTIAKIAAGVLHVDDRKILHDHLDAIEYGYYGDSIERNHTLDHRDYGATLYLKSDRCTVFNNDNEQMAYEDLPPRSMCHLTISLMGVTYHKGFNSLKIMMRATNIIVIREIGAVKIKTTLQS